jgi:hypothetical protein
MRQIALVGRLAGLIWEQLWTVEQNGWHTLAL